MDDVLEKIGRVGGWAPGNYMCTCVPCGSEFTGDKRAVHCLPCAIENLRGQAKEHDFVAYERAKDFRHDRNNRIEALRAASRIVAGTFDTAVKEAKGPMNVTDSTIYVAEQFAKYLEGE